MKHLFFFVCMVILPGMLQAHPTTSEHLAAAVEKQTARLTALKSLTSVDRYGTPYVLTLARQGEVEALLAAAQTQSSGEFLLLQDHYKNNIFHVAKDARTVQALAALIRQHYAAKTPQMLARLVNARNTLGEAPLNAQINAGHEDTFRLLYRYTKLRQLNDQTNRQLTRCQQIRKESSAQGITLLQAAKIQVPFHPRMQHVVQQIARTLPCLQEEL